MEGPEGPEVQGMPEKCDVHVWKTKTNTKSMKMVDQYGWMLEFRAGNDTKWSAKVVARPPGGFRPNKTQNTLKTKRRKTKNPKTIPQKNNTSQTIPQIHDKHVMGREF